LADSGQAVVIVEVAMNHGYCSECRTNGADGIERSNSLQEKYFGIVEVIWLGVRDDFRTWHIRAA
jgi:hypothetical protein